MDREEFYDSPDWRILQIWSGVTESKQREINAKSETNAQIASLFWGYIRGKTEHPEQLPDYAAKDFLPYHFKEQEKLDKETARILVEAFKKGKCPPKVVRTIVDCNLYDEIIKLGEVDNG